MPKQPVHERCHCGKKIISFDLVKSKAKAYCPIEKIANYIFSDNSRGKKQIFESLGFSIEDSYYLKSLFEQQALNQYLNGNYHLKMLINMARDWLLILI